MGGKRTWAVLGFALTLLVVCLPVCADSILARTSTGTGFIVSPDGYILTNEHVVEGATEVKITVGDREYTATVVSTLEGSDLALLRIDARGLPVVALGNADEAEVGDDVYALGCPRGICGTATVGRIANTGVTIQTDGGRELRGTLMIDSTIDHGSSGGPLVNARGEVVGINTAVSDTRFGFAIPINQAIPLLQRIPGFSTTQMGQATEEMQFRDIRALVGPSTTFVTSTLVIALDGLMPTTIAGYEAGRVRYFNERSSSADPPGSVTLPLLPRLPVVTDQPWFQRREDYAVPDRLGTGDVRAVDLSAGRDDLSINIMIAVLRSPGAAESAAVHVRQWDMNRVHPGSLYSVDDSRTVSRGSFGLGDMHVPYAVGWASGTRMQTSVGSDTCCVGILRGSGTLVVGDVLVAITIRWSDQRCGVHFLPLPFDLQKKGQHIYSAGCVSYHYRETDTRQGLPGRVLVNRTTTLLCLSDFMAEFERVFRIALQSFVDGLP